MQKVAILLTSYNRREAALSCLRNLYSQADAMKGEEKYDFSVYLVDDGSTDGTSDDVSEIFPGVKIIRTDGGLYWNQGMRLAWEEASKDEPDFYFWGHVGTTLHEGALSTLMETSEYLRHKAIVVGTCSSMNGALTYGGRQRKGRLIPPDDTIPIPCHTFDRNIVLVPRSVYTELGGLEAKYRHNYGDYDYGVRAFKSGIYRVIAPGVLGICERRTGIPAWRDSSYHLDERMGFLLSPKGRPPKEQFRYDCRNRGFFYALWHQISISASVLFPVMKKRRRG